MEIPVLNLHDNSEVETAPGASSADIDSAIANGAEGAQTIKAIAGYDRA